MAVLDNVLSAVEKAYKVAQKLHDAELQEAIADLRLGAAQLKGEMAELRAENIELRSQLEKLREKADLHSKVEFRNGLYYLTESVQGLGPGPFCTTCWEEDSLLISLQKISHGRFLCRRCAQKRH
jgi:hypothetical protein